MYIKLSLVLSWQQDILVLTAYIRTSEDITCSNSITDAHAKLRHTLLCHNLAGWCLVARWLFNDTL